MTEPTAPTGSAFPARLRIVAWIMLTVALGLLAVVLTVRSALLTDVENQANENIVQEIDEFATFAERGVDPDTGAPFGSAGRLLPLYLERQFPSGGEVLLGWDRDAARTGTSPLLAQTVDDRFGLREDQGLVRGLVDGPERSGTASVDGREFRWGRTDVDGGPGSGGGAFLVAVFLEPGREAVAEVVELVVVVCLGGLVLTVAIAFVVAGRILAPVRTVARAASRITRTRLGSRIEVRGRDDVAALALTFNAMLDRLQEASRVQRGFSTAAGIRLRDAVAVMGDDTRPAPERRAAGRRAGQILDDLDVLAAGQTPDFVDPRPTDLTRLTGSFAEDARALGGPGWVVTDVAHGTADVDPDRLRDAVARLARNALENCSGVADLRLGTRTTGDDLEIWVADDGPGLTAAQAARVLNRYQDQTSDHAGGVVGGLGLAVVRAVADAHEGSAWVETAPGAGALFGLRVPLRRVVPAGDATTAPVPARAAR
ncbi:signal transduction histidine kinase [Pseudonocardia sediminis]|uniref:histidine kinase n=1 Tax=Pseudonocardia sediminis TaxID=1397368 RepID=A0A4Q7V1A5_PSEST|nr:ATP-binding protein [Pseudonocardia sediminis]RZT87208.1 signal transduction histidine kinase [Pseudonocardia sediminis]